MGSRKDAVIAGLGFQHITSCLAVLDVLLLREEAVVSSAVLTSKTAVQPKKSIKERVAELMGKFSMRGFFSEV